MKTHIIYLLFTFCILSGIYAQNVSISGRVTDGKGEPLAFANIIIVQDKDSTTFVGTVTDMEGNFMLETTKENPVVKVSYLGYVTTSVAVKQNVLNTIKLEEDTNLLGEVVVRGTRQHFKMENGGIAMDVANSPLKNVGTANDVLEKQPFIVKNGDAISVLGKGTPLIYINNRLVRNDNELERLSSTHIKKVTVITNPGPEYDASVSAVVLIEAIRPLGEGIGGEVFGRMDVRSKISADGAVDLNYRKNKLDLFAYYGYSEKQREIDINSMQTLEAEENITAVQQIATQKVHNKFHYLEGGLNYELDERHSIGAKYVYTRTPYYKGGVDIVSAVTKDRVSIEEFLTNTKVDMNTNSHLLNAYYTGNVSPWLKVQLDMDYAKGSSENHDFSVSEREDEVEVGTRSLQDYDLYAGKLTLSTPLLGSNFNYGMEYSHTTNEQTYWVDENEGAPSLASNENMSKQKLFAAFLSYSKSIDKWMFNLGLRFENVGFDYFENGNKVDEQSRTYKDFFPQASVSYRSDKVQMMLGYRATIQRPSYYQLRNSIQYDDPYTYETGNPYLKPTRVDDISYSLLWKKIKLMVSYKMYDNMSLLIPHPYGEKQDIVMYIPENMDHTQNLMAMVYYSPRLGFWEPVAGLGVSKDYFRYGDTGQKYEKPFLRYSLQNTFRLPAGFVVMLDFQGTSKGHSNLTYLYDQFRMDVRVTKTFMKGNLILNLRGYDILGTYKQKRLMEVNPIVSLIDKNLDTRSWQFSVRYKFNASKSKYKGKSASEEERQRM